MNKQWFFGLAASFALVQVGYSQSGQQKPKVEDIIAKAENRKLPQSSRAEVLLTISKDGAKVDKTFKVLNLRDSPDESYSLIEFVKPTATKILVHGRRKGEDDRWIKTSSGQPKRISSSAGDQSFSQSHFDYADLNFAKGNEFSHELICEAKCEIEKSGAPHYKIKSTPKQSGAKYAYSIHYIRIDDSYPTVIEYYGKDGKLVKELISEDFKDQKGYLTPMKVTAKMSGTNSQSTMVIQSIVVDDSTIKRQLFDKNVL
jgi:hypothetical protein